MHTYSMSSLRKEGCSIWATYVGSVAIIIFDFDLFRKRLFFAKFNPFAKIMSHSFCLEKDYSSPKLTVCKTISEFCP
jgi:hypothetical protein